MMPAATTKPQLNIIVRVVLSSGKRTPGKWDGANWWVETQVGMPMLPIKDSFIKSWNEVKA